MRDDVKAAAERLIREAAIYHWERDQGMGGDIETVARYALEAGREVARLNHNEWAILYRLIDQYTEDAYKELPKDHASHATRVELREKVTKNLIAAQEAHRAALSTPGEPESRGGG